MKYILVIALVLLLVYWILKSYRRRVGRPGAAPSPPRGGEDMVRCEHCGVHLPRSESITTQGSFFCTPEHQRDHKRP